jgi:hypothetical protein
VTAQPETGYPPSRQGSSFSGYAGDAPSGLRFTGRPPDAEAAVHAPAPQAAYPDPALDRPAGELPGYLRPHPPSGGFSGNGPSAGPVVAFTVFFGVFGMISAFRRAKRAEAVGDDTGRYWMAFGVTLALGWVVGAIASLLALVAAGFFPAASSSASSAATPAQTITAAELSQSMEDRGTFTPRSGKTIHIRTATCTATSVDAYGAGSYRCAVSVTDGTKYTLSVRADSTGWRILGQTR